MNFISKWIAEFIFSIGHQAQSFWENLTLLNYSFVQVTIDIILVSVLFYYLFLLLRGSRAVNILLGLIFIGFVFILSKALQLATLGWILDRFFTVVLVAIPVIFQQEIRMALEKLGHTKFSLSEKAKEINLIVSSIVEACDQMAKEKVGALIVFENTIPLKEYVDTGVSMQSKVSKPLILSIFQPKSPLHDGAVIVKDGQIVAAACLLPHSFKNYGQILGTRHKAALGLSETTDAKIIVVSEEKGSISVVEKGNLERNITTAHLQNILTDFLKPKTKKKKA